MPKTASVESCREVPFSVTLYRLAVPLRVLAPVNVTVLGDVALKLPLTSIAALTEREAVVVTAPDTRNP